VYSLGRFRSTGPPEDGWLRTVCELHGGYDMESGDPTLYRGVVDWQATESFQVVGWRSEAERLLRTPQHVRSDPRSTYEVVLPLEGSCRVDKGSQTVTLAPGGLGMVFMDEPLVFTHQHCVALAFAAPAERLQSRQRNVPDMIIDANRGVGRIAAVLLQTLREERAAMSARAFDDTCDRLVDLLCMASEGAQDLGITPHRESIEAAIRRHVRMHAGDVTLDGAAVAAALGWSLRYVQAVLRAAGTTPSEIIRHERVKLARTLLSSPANRHVPVSRISVECGFKSHAAFSAAFRREFGMSPSEARGPVR
jgi:AraC-like DNA-binding protein